MFARKTTAAIVAISLVGATTLPGCATSSKDISSSYVSPIQYANYDCSQLTAEMQRIRGRVNQIAGRLDEAASNDKLIMGAGLLIFWPALFALGGTKGQEQEYSRLKGEYDAANQAAIEEVFDGAVRDKSTGENTREVACGQRRSTLAGYKGEVVCGHARYVLAP